MKAAVVAAFDQPPQYQDFPFPAPTDPDQAVLEVLAAGLHPRVRSQASGTHYTSTEELPLVPGIDVVGRDADGHLHYFVLPDTRLGSMAEHTIVDACRSVVLPADSDPITVAAGMNPAMSAWIALRQRVTFQPGQSVLVLGATGNAGQLAVQVARSFGAGQIVGAGRDAERLAALQGLGATDLVSLNGPADEVAEQLAQRAADVDVVIDYLWGEPATAAMVAVVTARTDRGHPLTWIQIGSVAGPSAAIPSAALRASRLQILGSGQGSVSTQHILTELPALAEAITDGTFQIDARPRALADVEQAWLDSRSTTGRIVLTP